MRFMALGRGMFGLGLHRFSQKMILLGVRLNQSWNRRQACTVCFLNRVCTVNTVKWMSHIVFHRGRFAKMPREDFVRGDRSYG